MPALQPYIIEPIWEQFELCCPNTRRTMHLDRAYDSKAIRQKLATRGLSAEISEKGKPAPLRAGKRWVVERTNSSWHNAHKKLF